MLCPHERKIAVAFERDTGADTGGEDHAISAALAVPVARQLLHGAGVLPERHAGPFLQAPSEHTLRKERPPAWSAPSIPARTPGAANENPQARRHITHNYSPQSPWPDDAGTRREKVLRPATAGQKHESQAWYLFRLPACLHILTHPRTHAPTHPRTHDCALAPLSRRAPVYTGSRSRQVGQRRACGDALVFGRSGFA